jgi:hypothetical protein
MEHDLADPTNWERKQLRNSRHFRSLDKENGGNQRHAQGDRLLFQNSFSGQRINEILLWYAAKQSVRRS